MDLKKKYKVIGLMSGTSLDGLDIAACVFTSAAQGWQYTIEKAVTVKYPTSWHKRLSGAHLLNADDLLALHVEYGKWLGQTCANFISKNSFKPDFISSHGHTVFHQPERGFTFQAGDGNAIHVASGVPVVSDFRSLDVALEGQGAPLVPIGDELLFSDYDICLNLGGIANLSARAGKRRIAYDICFMNMPLNYLASKIDQAYDKDGDLASDGVVNAALAKSLSSLYSKLRTKRPSLGREIFERQLKALLDNEKISIHDRLRTVTESSAQEVALALRFHKNGSVLCTGGGAFNSFFISRVLDYCDDDASLVIPDESIVKFKEALVFAFLGLRRVRGEVNCLKDVTGAVRNSSSGVMTGFKSR